VIAFFADLFASVVCVFRCLFLLKKTRFVDEHTKVSSTWIRHDANEWTHLLHCLGYIELDNNLW